MTDFVFLGPSLPIEAAQAILAAEYLPPVAMGDLYTLVRTRVRPGDRIAIIDGFFEQVPAVWHKEILFALESGIEVFGASSMGALRAAELHPFGMKGIGRIFEAYRDGMLEDDDEVAVAHAPADEQFLPLSTAMVSIRFGLRALADDGAIGEPDCARLTAHAKRRHYSQRSWADVYTRAKLDGLDDTQLRRLRELAANDAKADDARRLLSHLAEHQQTADACAPGFLLEQTAFWHALTRSQERQVAAARHAGHPAVQPLEHDLDTYVRASHPERDMLLRQAVLIKLARDNVAPTAVGGADLHTALHRVARRHGLHNTDEIAAWRALHDLDQREWHALLHDEARVDKLVQQQLGMLGSSLASALKASGSYHEVQDAVAQLRRRFGQSRRKELTLEDTGVTADQLHAWYRRHWGPMLPDPGTHARSLGFEQLGDLVVELLGAYLLSTEPTDTEATESGMASPA